MTAPIILGIAFAYGAAGGSFINVVALRYIDRLSLTLPLSRSRCPHCQQTLRWWELVPLFSFLWLRGRCLRCQRKISYQYFIVELLMGVLATLVVALMMPVLPTIFLLVIVALLLALAIIDYHTFLLPDSFLALLTVGVLCYWLARGGVSWEEVLGGISIGAGFLLLLWVATRGQGIGLGDVKLMIPLGALLGWQETMVMLFIAFCLGGVAGLVLLWRSRATLKTAVPFGPFLISAAWLVLLWPQLSQHFFALVLPGLQ